MNKKPCKHEYLAVGESGKVLMCRDCGVVHLHLQNLSMRFEVEQFAALTELLTTASQNMRQQPETNTINRSKLSLVH